MSSQRSESQRLADATQQVDTIDKVQMWRNAMLGGAAACLVMLTGLMQVADKSTDAFLAATLLISISLPCWVAASAIYETYVLLGQKSLPHLRSTTMKNLMVTLLGVGGFTLWGSVSSTIAILSGYAAATFVIVSVIAALFASFTHLLLARWWFGPEGPGTNDVSN